MTMTDMPRFEMKPLLAALILTLSIQPVAARADAIADLPVSTIFVTSSGLWEETAVEDTAPPATGAAQPGAETSPSSAPRRGYYKVVALRQSDGTALLHLQQIAYTADGPQLVDSVELEEFTQMKAYVTDIRPENSTGSSSVPGLFVTVYLKTDPTAKEPESWTILIDELGDMRIEKASN
jgi:hypothetical protein